MEDRDSALRRTYESERRRRRWWRRRFRLPQITLGNVALTYVAPHSSRGYSKKYSSPRHNQLPPLRNVIRTTAFRLLQNSHRRRHHHQTLDDGENNARYDDDNKRYEFQREFHCENSENKRIINTLRLRTVPPPECRRQTIIFRFVYAFVVIYFSRAVVFPPSACV